MFFSWFHKLFHWCKKTVANVDACVRFCNRKKQTLVRYREFLGFYYKQIIAWPVRSIWQQYLLVTFQNFPNTTDRFAARGILDNFEISLAKYHHKFLLFYFLFYFILSHKLHSNFFCSHIAQQVEAERGHLNIK